MALKTNTPESRLSTTAERLRSGGRHAREFGKAALTKIQWGPELTNEMLYPKEQHKPETPPATVPDDHLFTHDIIHASEHWTAGEPSPKDTNEKRSDK